MVKTAELSDLSNSQIQIVKRKGHIEPYSLDKMKAVVMWACEGDETLADDLLASTTIKLYDKMKIQDLYDQLINTAVNKISLLYPSWEHAAAKLYLLKIYKETWEIKNKEYPDFAEVVKKGLQYGVYGESSFDAYTPEQIRELGEYIDPSRDLKFTYKALKIFHSKYCKKYSKTKWLELPQHTYMRVAMALAAQEKSKVYWAKKFYDIGSMHKVTWATPIILNAGGKVQQLSSCVLSATADDTHSLNDSMKNVSVYSKYNGGTALDFSAVRASKSYIAGNNGVSSGPIPFIKKLEATIGAWNQGSTRKGACVVTFPWWHLDFDSLIVLKSNGGTEETRARHLMYSVKINDYLMEAVNNDDDVYLFDPKDVQNMISVTGDDFEKAYQQAIERTGIRKKKVKARDLWYAIMKQRLETGNIYIFFDENVNKTSMLNRYINSSNLCQEIVLPSRPSELISEELVTREDGSVEVVERYKSGEIALCNLASINLIAGFHENPPELLDLCETVVRAMDNTIDLAEYPVKEAKHANMKYRYLGIGVSNYANYLARRELDFESDEALKEANDLFEKISYSIILASALLAAERGAFPAYKETKWSEGILPHQLTGAGVNPKFKQVWEDLRLFIQKHGIRNASLMAIAPTATSSKAINSTESIEPVPKFFYKEEGTENIPSVAPDFKLNGAFYKKAFDIDNYWLLKHAIVRQKWIDQAQSVNMYVADGSPYWTSLEEWTKLHAFAWKGGLKTLYYANPEKDGEKEICESCT